GTLQTQLQNAADQSALAGAAELDGNDDSVVRAGRAVYGESGVEAQLTQNSENIAGQGIISSVQFRVLSSIPEDRNAIVCPVWMNSFADAQSYVPSGGGTHCATAWSNVRFIEVVVEQRTIGVSLIATLRTIGANSPTQAATTARSLAGFTQFVCQAPPLFTCNPQEAISGPDTVDMQRGEVLLMKAGGGGGAQYGAGDYGLLDPVFNNQGAKSISHNIASASSEGCFSTEGVEVNQGQKTGPVKEAINVRFDIYENPNFGSEQGNPEYRPARNVVRGCYGKAGCDTSYAEAGGKSFNSTPPEQWDPAWGGAPYPRAQCFYTGTCNKSCNSGVCRMSTGADWPAASRDMYWDINHPNSTTGSPGAGQYSRPAGWDTTMTRYDVYRWEIDNNHIPNRQPSASTASDATGENANPTHYTGGVLNDTPDRRILIVAVINCIEQGPILGNSGGPYAVEKYAKFFLLEPVDSFGQTNKDIWGEFVGFIEPGADDGVLRDVVQLYR
ncbi:MAG TPA: hypothetical protein VLG66_05900, partial [Alphaproteobacteria bacterium]|nr:hypothetical protein [Alphaproteobacteria bacterium]